MEINRPRFVIGEREAAEIANYCEIATANKSLLTLSELIELTSIEATEEDLEGAWYQATALSSRYLLDSGYVRERSDQTSLLGDPVEREQGNRERALTNLSVAKDFARLCMGGDLKLLAMAGGNSYKSARANDDIDFFCVTTKNGLWRFLARSLLLARFHRLSKRSAPFCFSYVVEEPRAAEEFGEPKDGLFARDALSAEVLSGASFYHSLLTRAGWMERYFPRMYRNRLAEDERRGGRAGPEVGGRSGSRVLNLFLYRTVGTYIKIKAFLLNQRFRKSGKIDSMFRVVMDTDVCVYESNRYWDLRRMYGAGRRRRSDA